MAALALTVADAVKVSGLTRSRIYVLLGEGRIDARKAGKRTLILGDSLRAYLESLPSVQIGQNRATAAVEQVAA